MYFFIVNNILRMNQRDTVYYWVTSPIKWINMKPVIGD
jgi:hypothetical protein